MSDAHDAPDDPPESAADTAAADSSALPRFTTEADGHRLRVYDPIDDVTTTLLADEPLAPAEASTAEFYFPVDSAVSIEAGRLRTSTRATLHVRDGETGEHRWQVGQGGSASIPAPRSGRHAVEVVCGPMKTYLHVEEPFRVVPTDGGTELRFDTAGDSTRGRRQSDGRTTVRVGVRSIHESPAATLGVSADAAGVMAALSRFGSALKTDSPERSFPTLRGHPPLLAFPSERGADGASRAGEASYLVDGVPAVDPVVPLDARGPSDGSYGDELLPETRAQPVTIHVPPAPEWVFPVASLAYYLDAVVQPAGGGPPRLSVRSGTVPTPESDDDGALLTEIGTSGAEPVRSVVLGERTDPVGYEERVFDLLRHLFTLDCFVRTADAGFYDDRLVEYERVRESLPAWFDRDLLYRASLETRTCAYLAVPTSVTEPVWPRWRTTADLPPSFEHATLLPFFANELARVRVFDPEETHVPQSARAEVGQTPDDSTATAGSARSVGTRAPEATPTIRLPETSSITQVWGGPGLPAEGGTCSATSYLERLRSPPRERETTRVLVVCNAPEMEGERAVSDIYGTRESLPFDVTVHESLTKSALRDTLRTECDLLHYIGHVRPEGIECTDGHLSVDEIAGTEVGCRAFLLNACASYAPAAALVEAGALVGVGTRAEVFDTSATEVGREMARLLDRGFPFDVAVERVAAQFPVAGSRYLTFGDGSLSLVQHESGMPLVARVTPREADRFEVGLETFGSRGFDVGSTFVSHLAPQGVKYLSNGDVGTHTVSAERLDWFLGLGTFPVEETVRGTHWWSDEVDAATLADPPARRED